MSELYIEAGAENDAEEFKDGQTKSNSAQNYQVVLRRLQELVNAALRKMTV